ncbi:MAG: BREX system ATP-binding domain-containing protein [Jatrophihabitantaceae bacterium]
MGRQHRHQARRGADHSGQERAAAALLGHRIRIGLAVSELQGSGLPLGGTGLSAESYADFVAKEYLGEYVRTGGAAVRFVVTGADDVAQRWHRSLASSATAEGYLYVAAGAGEVRVHLIDQLYAAVARQLDWDELARQQVREAWEQLGLPSPDADTLSVAAIAEHHEVDAREAARSMRRQLEGTLLRDPSLAREFRLAVLRLCQAQLATGDVLDSERAAVLSWLRVEPVALRDLRSASLYARIGRHNARSMLVSLAAWRVRVVGTGLVLDLDLDRLAVSRRPPVDERSGYYYSKAAVLDAYEVLRQLVDATDSLRGVFVAAALPPQLVSDEARGLPAYHALQLRVVDEVRDRRRANPFAALVRLETRLEVTA